jgi:hypothetical protein
MVVSGAFGSPIPDRALPDLVTISAHFGEHSAAWITDRVGIRPLQLTDHGDDTNHVTTRKTPRQATGGSSSAIVPAAASIST